MFLEVHQLMRYTGPLGLQHFTREMIHLKGQEKYITFRCEHLHRAKSDELSFNMSVFLSQKYLVAQIVLYNIN